MSRLRSSGVHLAVVLLVAFTAAGCSPNGEAEGGEQGHGHDSHSGHTTPDGLPDNIETTTSFEVLPSFLDHFTETTKQYYASVHEHQDFLSQLNCYCGCMDYNDPHDSLLRCFIVGTDAEGVHWTDHGSACGICLMELRDAVKMADEGKTIDEIRAHIDSTYGGEAS